MLNAVHDSQFYPILTAMITPALFMTATGSLLISTTNRMVRVIDRVRTLNKISDELAMSHTQADQIEKRQQHILDQLAALEWRSHRIRRAINMLYAAFGTFVTTSLSLAIDGILDHQIRVLPTILAVGGVSLILVACIDLLREAQVALKSTRDEIRFLQKLRARKSE